MNNFDLEINTEELTDEELGELFNNEVSSDNAKHFVILNDNMANWSLRKIAEDRNERNRLLAIADAEIAAIMEKVQALKDKCERKTAFLTQTLERYFDTVEHRETKTTRSYPLLDGKLVRKLGGVKPECDREKLLAWLKSHKMNSYVKVKEEADWAAVKKLLVFDTDNAKYNDEVVDGVIMVEKPDIFSVEVD